MIEPVCIYTLNYIKVITSVITFQFQLTLTILSLVDYFIPPAPAMRMYDLFLVPFSSADNEYTFPQV